MSFVRICLGAAACGALLLALAVPALAADTAVEEAEVTSVLDHTVENIDGEEVALKDYKGDVLLMVNVASKCGLTPQYEQLQAVYEQYKDQDFKVLGFPANNFLSQEPGTNEEIKFFCTEKYDVTFDMFSKISVKGDDKAPLYAYLTEEETNPEFAGDITWNFEKFLVSRAGEIIARFSPRTKPDDPKVIEAIEAALADEAE